MYRVRTKEELSVYDKSYFGEEYFNKLLEFAKKFGGMECKRGNGFSFYIEIGEKNTREYEKVGLPMYLAKVCPRFKIGDKVKKVDNTFGTPIVKVEEFYCRYGDFTYKVSSILTGPFICKEEDLVKVEDVKPTYEFLATAFEKKIECKPMDNIPTIQATISAEELMKQWQKVIKEGSEDMKGVKEIIKSVHFNEKKGVTTVVLTNGAKGISRASGGDQYDKYIGFAMALQNALFGSRTQAIKFVDEKYNNQMRIEKAKLKAKIKKENKKDE